VLLHGCQIGDESLVGNGARVLDGARIGRQCLIAAGSLIPPNKEIPDRSVVMGAPGKVVRQVTEEDLAMMAYAAAHYRQMIVRYRKEIPIDSRSH
jgi:carbonic anhydrase/acetyltransferase-like protein (isoleucine patch superfamily)